MGAVLLSQVRHRDQNVRVDVARFGAHGESHHREISRVRSARRAIGPRVSRHGEVPRDSTLAFECIFMIRLANMSLYVLCELLQALRWVYGPSKQSALWQDNQRHSAYLPGRFDHCQALETGGALPAQNGPTFDTWRHRGVRSGLARMAGARWKTHLPGGLGDCRQRGTGGAPDASTDCGLPIGITTHRTASTFDARTAPPRRVARMDRRDARLTTFTNIK